MAEGYSDITLDHYESPRNNQLLEDANAVSALSNPVCGDKLQLTLRIDREVVQSAGFTVDGCVAATAAASMMSEMVTGRALSEAAGLSAEAIDSALGGLPAGRAHGAQLAADALATALASFQLSSTGRDR
ncbi:MAG TPA: iron-sulfur cluster assembly scaffold protein [Dehalococcoidia bacterium]|nr:iron-sulfur cluster assembly scaffold protein [Dehalococcoidia bacterium]